MAGDPTFEESMTKLLAAWRASGYTEDFSIAGRLLRCGRCEGVHDPREAEIIGISRFEGASNPDDEAIVFALACRRCGARGVLVNAYGPTASGEEAEVMAALTDARHQ
jgi:hypothetical protein